MGSADRHSRSREIGESGRDDLDLLASHGPAFAGVRVEPGERQAWFLYSKARSEIPRGNETCRDQEFPRQ